MKNITSVFLSASPFLMLFSLFYSPNANGQKTLPNWASSFPCIKNMGDLIKTDGNKLYYTSKDGTFYTLYSDNTLSASDGSTGTWKCDGYQLSLKSSLVKEKKQITSENSTQTFNKSLSDKNANLRKQNNDQRKLMKIPEIMETRISRDECKSAIKTLYDKNKGKGKDNISNTELENIKRKVCRCILQGESYSGGILGIGDEFKEIQSYPSSFGIPSKEVLFPVSNIKNDKDNSLTYGDKSIFKGDIDNRLPNGIGTRRFEDGTRYEGNFAGGYFHGFGKLYMLDGTVREGIWYNNKLNGKGKEIFKDGTLYDGYFIDDERQLRGIYKYASGSIYEGEFLNGKFDGFGKLSFSSGGYYEGEWLNDKRDGTGKYLYADGTLYEGQFMNDKFYGYGKLKSKEGDLYEAEFSNNEITGACTIKRLNGDIYEGTYSTKTDIGNGTIKYKNGETYNGQWLNFQRNGQGKLFSNDGYVYDGNWKMNVKNGNFLKYAINGYPNRIELIFNSDIQQPNYVKIWESDQLYFTGDPNGYAIITKNGNTYQGYVTNYLPNGQGKLISANGEIFEGNIINYQLQGPGKYTNKAGDVFEANFVNSKAEGNFKINFKNGSIFEGVAKNGVIEGPATLKNPDGSYEKGDYKNDSFVKNEKYFNSKNASQGGSSPSEDDSEIKFKYISNTTNICKWCSRQFYCQKKSPFELEMDKSLAKAILKNTNLKSFDSVMLSSPLAGLLLLAPNPEEYLNEVAERKKGIYRINLYNCDEFCSPKCKACYNKEPNCQ